MEPSKKYLIHCIAWNILGFIVLMSPWLDVISGILGDFSIFILWSVAVIISPLILLIIGVYLLWRGTPRWKLIVAGSRISTLCLLLEVWAIDGLFVSPLTSQIFCTKDTEIPPRYLCSGEERGYICGEDSPYFSNDPCPQNE